MSKYFQNFIDNIQEYIDSLSIKKRVTKPTISSDSEENELSEEQVLFLLE